MNITIKKKMRKKERIDWHRSKILELSSRDITKEKYLKFYGYPLAQLIETYHVYA